MDKKKSSKQGGFDLPLKWRGSCSSLSVSISSSANRNITTSFVVKIEKDTVLSRSNKTALEICLTMCKALNKCPWFHSTGHSRNSYWAPTMYQAYSDCRIKRQMGRWRSPSDKPAFWSIFHTPVRECACISCFQALGRRWGCPWWISRTSDLQCWSLWDSELRLTQGDSPSSGGSSALRETFRNGFAVLWVGRGINTEARTMR